MLELFRSQILPCLWLSQVTLHSDLADESSGGFCSFRWCCWRTFLQKQGIPCKHLSLCPSTATHTQVVNMSLCPMSLHNCPIVVKCVKKKHVAFAVSRKLFWPWMSKENVLSLLVEHAWWHWGRHRISWGLAASCFGFPVCFSQLVCLFAALGS